MSAGSACTTPYSRGFIPAKATTSKRCPHDWFYRTDGHRVDEYAHHDRSGTRHHVVSPYLATANFAGE
jgi:hypothetical protein